MSKKEFKSGLDNLFKKELSDNTAGIKKAENNKTEIRATFIVEKEQLDIIKALAYWERKQIKELVFESFNLLITKREQKEINDALFNFKSKIY